MGKNVWNTNNLADKKKEPPLLLWGEFLKAISLRLQPQHNQQSGRRVSQGNLTIDRMAGTG